MKAGIWPNTTVEESPFYKSVAIRSRQSQIAPTVQIFKKKPVEELPSP